MPTHYTATVEVTKTTHTPATTNTRGFPHTHEPAKRDVDKVAHIVIRADSLAELADKITAHTALLKPNPTAKDTLA